MSFEKKPIAVRNPDVDLVTEIPLVRTSAGMRPSAWLTRFCTSTAARSGSRPISNVTVIVDRREGPDRRNGRSYGGKREIRDRRRARVPGTFPEIDAPEFRMAEDARIATEPVVDFVIGITNAGLLAITFLGVLWSIGGSITIAGYTIPGYMVFASLLYACFMSGFMAWLVRPLVQKVERRWKF